jgi:HPt (histidine-containing phosphotransfer) domain-containing protein
MGTQPTSESSAVSSTDSESLVDADTLLAACDDDPMLLSKLIDVFKDNISGSLARVEEAINLADPHRLRESAHQLRGLLSTFSKKAARATSLLEAMGAAGEFGDSAFTFKTLANMTGPLRKDLEHLQIGDLRRHSSRLQG